MLVLDNSYISPIVSCILELDKKGFLKFANSWLTRYIIPKFFHGILTRVMVLLCCKVVLLCGLKAL